LKQTPITASLKFWSNLPHFERVSEFYRGVSLQHGSNSFYPKSLIETSRSVPAGPSYDATELRFWLGRGGIPPHPFHFLPACRNVGGFILKF
jgi:hypothetical protein